MGTTTSGVRQGLHFLGSFFRNPFQVGAVLPSSRALGRMMLAPFDVASADLVVEVGPGTGAFTGLILDRLREPSKYMGIELNPSFVEHLRREYPQATFYRDSVERLGEILVAGEGSGKADLVVCGLPWAQFGDELQERLLGGILTSLRPGGGFCTFAYIHALAMPGARKFRRRLETTFSRVEQSPVVWRNVPPAIVYSCRSS